MDSTDRQQRPSLAEERQQLTQARIRRAAMEVVARRGFDATVDEIAEVSGVSPRTIFRHYATHDGLIAATVRDMFEACGLPRSVDTLERSIEGSPQISHDVDLFIEGIATTWHTRSASIFGAAFWDIYSPGNDASEVFCEVHSLRRAYRVRGVGHVVDLVWQRAGGMGQPPVDLVMAFALNLSVFATQALTVDFDQTPAQIGSLTADILKMLVRRAIQQQCAMEGGSDPTRGHGWSEE